MPPPSSFAGERVLQRRHDRLGGSQSFADCEIFMHPAHESPPNFIRRILLWRTDSALGTCLAEFRQSIGISEQILLAFNLSGPERLCQFVAQMARRTGRRGKNGWELSLPMSRDNIADYLGLNPETVSRLFTQLKKKELIQMPRPTVIKIHNLERLESTASLTSSTAAG